MKLPPALRRFTATLWREWVRPLALPLVCIAAAKSALADINIVPSGSMKPTILEGDVVFVNKLAYDLRIPFTHWRVAQWGDPVRGDVVVCFPPDAGTRLVKRVVGLPGDTVELRGETVILNGVAQRYSPLPDDALRDLSLADRRTAIFARETLAARSHALMVLPGVAARRDFGPVLVPSRMFFVLGDNRDNSHDSRFFGFVARTDVMGEVKGTVASADPHHWFAPRFSRFGRRME